MSLYTSRIPHALQFQDPGPEVVLARLCWARLTCASDHEEKIIDVFPDRQAALHWLHQAYDEQAVRRVARFARGWRGAVDEEYQCARWAYGMRLEDTYTIFNV